MRARAALAILLPAGAAAEPSFKQAPGVETKAEEVPAAEGDGGEFPLDLGGIDAGWYVWLDRAMQFGVDNWHWFGLVYTGLVLYLFVTAPGQGEAGQSERPSDEIFFDEDYEYDIPYR